jgi:serine kinase of HPr protein (carbohydrate metabolism regulator)
VNALTLHAGCVAIAGRGVLIEGPSGAGKSDLALRLIDRGATLVSDDYTNLSAVDGRVIASPPDTIAGRMEVRGLGIVDRPHLRHVAVALVATIGAPERMPEPSTRQIAGIVLPVIVVAALEPSAPIKIELALDLFGVRP